MNIERFQLVYRLHYKYVSIIIYIYTIYYVLMRTILVQPAHSIILLYFDSWTMWNGGIGLFFYVCLLIGGGWARVGSLLCVQCFFFFLYYWKASNELYFFYVW